VENRKYHVLVIEDNPGDFLLIQDFLEEEFGEVHISRAECFKSARALFHQISGLDIILLDLSLPDSSGETLVNNVLKLAGTVPLIVLTGFADKEFSVKSLSMGVSDYLLKDELSSSSLFKSVLYSIERKAISNKLEHSEQRYKDIFRLSPQPMFLCEKGSERLLSVNEAALRKYGFSLGEFLSMRLKDLETDDFSSEIVDSEYKGGSGHKTKGGETIFVEVQSNSVFFDEEEAVLIIASDITDRMNYINKIEQQNRKLSDIAWIQSHILRAPLVRMMGLIEMMEEEYKIEDDQKDIILNLKSSCHELDGIIRDILKKADRIKTSQNI